MGLLLALLLSQSTPGVPVRSVPPNILQYTTAAQTYYVDTTGSDSNDCISALTPCATLTGVDNKLPWDLRNIITVNVAGLTDGGVATYTESINLNHFAEGGAISIVGPSLVAIVPDAGTASGTFTAVSNTIPAVFTDSGKSWTTDNFVGAFLVVTGGTGSGGIIPIIANTATTITTAVSYSVAPTTSSTYEIRVPGATFTQGTSATATFNVRLAGAASLSAASTTNRVIVTAIDFVSTGTGPACTVSATSGQLNFTNSRCRATASNTTGLIFMGGSASFTSSVFMGTGAAGFGAVFGPASPGTSGTVGSSATSVPYFASFNRSNFISSAGSAVIFYTNGTVTPQNGGLGARGTATSATGVMQVQGRVDIGGITNATTWAVYCNSAVGQGIYLINGKSNRSIATAFDVSSFYVSGCDVGVLLDGPNATFWASGNSNVCNNITTTCITPKNGSFARTGTLTITGSSPTNEVQVDDLTLTISQVNAFIPPIVTNSTQGTTFSRQ